jgi:hypothetical protein
LLMAGCGAMPVTLSSAVIAPDSSILAFQGDAGKSADLSSLSVMKLDCLQLVCSLLQAEKRGENG